MLAWEGLLFFYYSTLGKPLRLVDLIRIAYSVDWKKYDRRIR